VALGGSPRPRARPEKKAVQARMLADGFDRNETIKRWNRDDPPYPPRPVEVYRGMSDEWKREYDAHVAAFTSFQRDREGA
jgi:hypothetical protein